MEKGRGRSGLFLISRQRLYNKNMPPLLNSALLVTLGLLPSLLWLSYYLRKDCHPEPKTLQPVNGYGKNNSKKGFEPRILLLERRFSGPRISPDFKEKEIRSGANMKKFNRFPGRILCRS